MRGSFRRVPWLLGRDRCFFLDASLRCEINGKAAEPMSAFVMRASDRCEPRAPMRVCRGLQGRSPLIIVWQRRQNSFQHPGAAQV